MPIVDAPMVDGSYRARILTVLEGGHESTRPTYCYRTAPYCEIVSQGVV
jgi:hypothetical protein